MAVKNNWSTGDPVTASQLNDHGSAIIALQAMATNAAQAYVATPETTASTTYTDLTTTTDQVTVTIGSSGMALVFISAQTLNNTGGYGSPVGFAVSGATSIAADDTRCIWFVAPASGWTNPGGAAGAPYLLTGLNVGSTTFKMKYKTTGGGTGTFAYRRIAVIPL